MVRTRPEAVCEPAPLRTFGGGGVQAGTTLDLSCFITENRRDLQERLGS